MIGSESFSARDNPAFTVLVTSRSPLASPISWMVKPGAERCNEDTASRTGGTRFAAPSADPFSSNATSAAWPSLENCPPLPGASGERNPLTCGRDLSLATTAASSALKAGVELPIASLCTSTVSLACSLNPARSSISWARPAWPSDCSRLASLTVPTAFPATIATATNASHPKVAVFQWAALQRPARAAMFMAAPLRLPAMHRQLRLGERPRQCGALVSGTAASWCIAGAEPGG